MIGDRWAVGRRSFLERAGALGVRAWRAWPCRVVASRTLSPSSPDPDHFRFPRVDNFEWAEGYTQRFGLVHVDFKTQKRRVKDSGRWYARVAAVNALVS